MTETIIITLLIIFLTIYAYWITMYSHKNKIIKNIEDYDKKEKTKQQESKVLGQKQDTRKGREKKKTRMYHF